MCSVRSAGRPGSSDQAHGTFFVDGHAHLYRMYDRDAFFDGALANVTAAAAHMAPGRPFWGCLLFSETARDHAFAELGREAIEGRAGRRWSLRPTAEEGSLVVRLQREDRLIVVAGRQIQCEEGLELLALFCVAEFAEGLPLRDALATVRARNALAVLPWGFGKWWLGRGRLLHDVLRSDAAAGVWLGDNGGRPRAFPAPRAFRLGESTGRLVLPGSDTLPLASEAGRVAHYGFVLEGSIDLERPGVSLKRLLLAHTKSPPPFGSRIGLARFARNQIKLSVAKRAARMAEGP
jgi:hypothetical protein